MQETATPTSHRWQDQAEEAGRRVGIPATIAIVVLTALTIAVGYLITRTFDGSIGDLDRTVAQDLADGRTTGRNTLTAASAVFANTAPVALLWLGAVAFTLWRTRRWPLPVFLLAAVGGEKLTYLIASIVVGRDRPKVPALGHVYATNSFPSGHVAAAITLYGGLAVAAAWWSRAARDRPFPAAVRLLLGLVVVAIAGLVGFSRVYRGHHYLSDVVWGVVLGTTWLTLAWHLALRRTSAMLRE